MQVPNFNFNVANPISSFTDSYLQARQQAQQLSLQKQQIGLQQQLESLKQQQLMQQMGQSDVMNPLYAKQLQQQIDMAPQMQAIAAQNANTNSGKLSQSQSRFGAPYQLLQWSKTPAGQAVMSDNNNPEVANAVFRVVNNTGTQADNDLVKSLTGMGYSPQMMTSPIMGQPMQQGGGMPVSGQPTNNQRQAIQDAIASSLMKQTMTGRQQQQILASESLQQAMKRADESIDDATKFAGVSGSANKKLQEFKDSTGLGSSPEYKNYLRFVNVDAPAFSSELRKQWGDNATDQQKKALEQISNPISWDKSPQSARMMYDRLKEQVTAVDRALAANPSQNMKDLLNRVNKIDSSGGNNVPRGTNSNSSVTGSDGNSYTVDQLMAIISGGK